MLWYRANSRLYWSFHAIVRNFLLDLVTFKLNVTLAACPAVLFCSIKALFQKRCYALSCTGPHPWVAQVIHNDSLQILIKSTIFGDCKNIYAKITPVCVPIYPHTNYPHIQGVQVDLFWNGSELKGNNVWIVEMCCLVRSLWRWHIGSPGCCHANSATAPEVAGRALAMTIWKFENGAVHLSGFEMQSISYGWQHCRQGRSCASHATDQNLTGSSLSILVFIKYLDSFHLTEKLM